MAEPKFSYISAADFDDDLPRTLRREHESRARQAGEAAWVGDAAAATVTRLDIPFLHLLAFFLKAVIAAIPALILLMVLLWLAGETLTATFPDLVKMQVLIRLPQ